MIDSVKVTKTTLTILLSGDGPDGPVRIVTELWEFTFPIVRTGHTTDPAPALAASGVLAELPALLVGADAAVWTGDVVHQDWSQVLTGLLWLSSNIVSAQLYPTWLLRYLLTILLYKGSLDVKWDSFGSKVSRETKWRTNLNLFLLSLCFTKQLFRPILKLEFQRSKQEVHEIKWGKSWIYLLLDIVITVSYRNLDYGIDP